MMIPFPISLDTNTKNKSGDRWLSIGRFLYVQKSEIDIYEGSGLKKDYTILRKNCSSRKRDRIRNRSRVYFYTC